MKFKGVIRKEEILKPYSGPSDPNLPQAVQDLSEDQRAQWVAIFNSAYNSCIADGGSESDCETRAFQTAWGVVNAEEDNE